MTKNDPKSKAPQAEPEGEHHDDLILVPKGRSRKQFLFTLGLTIFVLIIFTVGADFQSTMGGLFGGGGQDNVYLKWTDPLTKTRHEVKREEFQARYRTLKDFSSIGLFGTMHPPEEDNGGRPQVGPEDAAMFLILEELADTSGIRISDTDFRQFMLQMFRDTETLRGIARQLRIETATLESELRKFLRCDSVLRLLQAGAGIAADPTFITQAWEEGHPQYSFEYLSVPTDSFVEAAKAEAPEAEALEEWYRARPEWEREKHFTEARFLPHVAWLTLESDWDATALLEKYPAVEGVDPESQAKNYHRLYSNIRFRMEEESSDDGEEGDESGEATDEPAVLYQDYEDVAEVCRTEAPIQAALALWLADMRSRQNDPANETPLDFAAEAAALGLTVSIPEAALTKAEIEEVEGWGGKNLAMRFFPRLTAETFISTPVVEEGAMIVSWVSAVEERKEPPFEEILEAVSEDWAAERSRELASERLEALRDGFGERPEGVDEATWTPSATAEQFAAAAATLELTVNTRPFLERGEESGDEAHEAYDNYLQLLGMPLFDLEVDGVSAAQPDLQGENVFLSRLAGERTRPFEEVTAKQFYGGLQGQAISRQITQFRENVMRVDSDWFRTTFDIDLYSWNEDEAGEVEG